jgi:hypothetical protein
MVAETLCEPLVNALKLILSETNEGTWKPAIYNDLRDSR